MHRTEGKNNIDGLFTEGPPATTLPDDWLNAIQEEICYVIEQAGLIVLGSGTDTRQQLLQALKQTSLLVDNYKATMTGVDGAFSIAFSNDFAVHATETFEYTGGGSRVFLLDPGTESMNFNPYYRSVFPIGFRAEVINTGAFNITFDSEGSKQIVTPGTRLVSIFDGTNWL